jgi:hypothetical protein
MQITLGQSYKILYKTIKKTKVKETPGLWMGKQVIEALNIKKKIDLDEQMY